MQPGYVFQSGEFDSEILRSADYQLISITLDSTATYSKDGTSTSAVTKIPKGTLLTKDSNLSDGTYTVVDTASGQLNGTPTQYMSDAVVLAETIIDASDGDQPVKAYYAGTFNWSKIKYTNSDDTTISAAQIKACAGRLKFVDGPQS